VRPCDWHRETARGVAVHWPAEFRDWAASHKLLNLTVALPTRSTSDRYKAPATTAAAAVRVLSPPDGAVYLIDPMLRREFQTVALRGDAEGASLEWSVDDAVFGTTSLDAPLNWPLTSGRHVISVRDPQGRSASASIVVK